MSALRNMYNQLDNISKELLFELDDKLLSINITHIRQITKAQSLRFLPDQPRYIKGVINLHDQIIPIMDLRLKVGLKEKPYDDRTCFIILQVNHRYLGIIVDKVLNIVSFNQDEVVNDADKNHMLSNLINGYARDDRGEVFLLDPYKLY